MNFDQIKKKYLKAWEKYEKWYLHEKLNYPMIKNQNYNVYISDPLQFLQHSGFLFCFFDRQGFILK